MELDQRWYKVLPGALLCALLWGSAFPCLKTVYGIWEEAGFEPGLGDPVVILITCWLCFVSAFAFSLWNHLSTKFPVPLLAGYRFLIPLCGMGESLVFIKGETAGWGLVTGACIVVVSLVLMQRARVVGSV